MYAPPRVLRAAHRARGISTVAEEAVVKPMERLRLYSSQYKDTATLVGAMAGGAAAIVYAANYTMGWQPKLTALETRMESLATKLEVAEVGKSVAKTETEVKNLATKEEVGKVETEVKNVLQSARLEGENAALRAWKEKEASVAGGRASLGSN
jgi:F0F1-type ATP synthase membrane subunit b/b'